jgi:hypothetical protein
MGLRVLRSKKDDDGDITGLCGDGWSHTKQDVIARIAVDRYAYYVSAGGQTVFVRVGRRNLVPYLTTHPDGTKPNNLDNLPPC